MAHISLHFSWKTLVLIKQQTNTIFFISNTFISKARLKLAKNQAKAKQHPETELLLFENFFVIHIIIQNII